MQELWSDLPATLEYGTDSATKDGLFPFCKTCNKKRASQWQTSNPERARARKSKWREDNREHSRAYQLAYFNEHYRDDPERRDKRNAFAGSDTRATPSVSRAASGMEGEEQGAHQQVQPRLHAEVPPSQPRRDQRSTAQPASKKANAPGTHTAADVERLYKEQKGRCFWCSSEVGGRYHIDHLIPLSKGGSNGPENIVIACPLCNVRKHDKMPWEFMPERFAPSDRRL